MLIGFAIALFEVFIVDSKDVGAVVAAVALMFASTTLLLRKEIDDALGGDIQRILSRVDRRWRDDAEHRARMVAEELEEWANGRRPLGAAERIRHQAELLDRARSEVLAVHVATDREKLAIWDSESTGFNDLVQRFLALKAPVKRRVLVLDDGHDGLVKRESGRLEIVDDLALRVCRLQETSQADGGMGFELRIRWVSDGPLPRDVLIVDDREAVVVDVGNVSNEYDAEAIVSPVRLSSERKLFDSTWTLAHPASHYLPSDGPASFESVEGATGDERADTV